MSRATSADFELFGTLRERRCPEGHFIGDSPRVVRRMIELGAAVKVLCSPEWEAKLGAPPGVEIRTAPRERIDAIVGNRLHQRIMALGRIPDPGPIRGSLLVALDGLANAENVGAVLRACAAFGVEGVLVGAGTSSPWLRRAVRVSVAAPLRVPVHFPDDLPATLRTLNAWGAHIHGERIDYTKVDCRGDVCLVLGGEAKGLSAPVLEACRGVISIPMASGWDCINVASSAAVLLAEVRRQRA